MTECDGHFGSTALVVGGLLAVLTGRTHGNGVDAGHVAIGCTRIVRVTSVPRCPNVNGTFTVSTLYIFKDSSIRLYISKYYKPYVATFYVVYNVLIIIKFQII